MRFLFDLALAFGRPVGELLDTIDDEELRYWQVYHQQVMVGPMRDWYHWAHKTTMAANAGRSKTDKKVRLRDLMPEIYR